MRRQRETHKGIAGTSAADVTTEAAVVKIAEKSARDCFGLHSVPWQLQGTWQTVVDCARSDERRHKLLSRQT